MTGRRRFKTYTIVADSLIMYWMGMKMYEVTLTGDTAGQLEFPYLELQFLGDFWNGCGRRSTHHNIRHSFLWIVVTWWPDNLTFIWTSAAVWGIIQDKQSKVWWILYITYLKKFKKTALKSLLILAKFKYFCDPVLLPKYMHQEGNMY